VGNFADTSLQAVRERLPHPDKAVFRAGYFPETAKGLEETFAVVSLDADLYKPLYEGLNFFYPRMTPGGYIIIHDYNNSRFSGARHAVRRFCEENQVFVVPLSDLHGTGIMVKPKRKKARFHTEAGLMRSSLIKNGNLLRQPKNDFKTTRIFWIFPDPEPCARSGRTWDTGPRIRSPRRSRNRSQNN
jgi:hypothetical protein